MFLTCSCTIVIRVTLVGDCFGLARGCSGVVLKSPGDALCMMEHDFDIVYRRACVVVVVVVVRWSFREPSRNH